MQGCLEAIVSSEKLKGDDGCTVLVSEMLSSHVQSTFGLTAVLGSNAFISSRNIVLETIKDETHVALKIKLPASSVLPSEMEILKKIRCASIPPVLQQWSQDAFAMPWYPVCLFDVVADDRVTRVLAWRVVAAVSRALLHAHSYNVTHCDLKPENVFMEDGSGRGCVLGDWDLACDGKQEEMRDLRTGTLEYNPPPCFGASDVSVTADVFRLGALMYVLLFRTAPVWREDGSLYDLVTEDDDVYVDSPFERSFFCRKFEIIMLRVLTQGNLPRILLLDVYAEALENIFRS